MSTSKVPPEDDSHTLPESPTPRVRRDTLPLLLSVAMAARELSISEDFIRNRIESGRIPATKLGRNVRIRRETVLELAGALDQGNSDGEE